MERKNIKKTKQLRERVFNPNQEDIRNYSGTEAFCSASFTVFLPHLPHSEHRQRFREVLFNQYYAFIERGDLNLADNLDLSGLKLIEDTGFILCSFHYGAYKLLSASLIKSNRKFFVVINNSVSQEIKDANHDFFRIGKKRYKNTVQEKLIHLEAENVNFIFHAKELIEQGYIMLIFLDGNSGLDGIMNTTGKNMYGITFLDNEIYVKKGLTALSYAYNVPILPVFSLRNQDSPIIKIESLEPLYPDFSMTRNDYSKVVTQKLYSLLEDKVIENPFEWEGWIYVHKWLNIKNLTTEEEMVPTHKKIEELKFNDKKYVTFMTSDKEFLLEKRTHLAYQISPKAKQIIDGNRSLLKEDELDFYLVNNILV